MAYFLVILVLIVAIGAGLPIWRSRERSARIVVDIVTGFYLFAFIGLAGLLAFYGHVFTADSTADSIGFPAGNPFQTEVGFANLAYGVAGLLCLYRSRGFRWARRSHGGFLLGRHLCTHSRICDQQ